MRPFVLIVGIVILLVGISTHNPVLVGSAFGVMLIGAGKFRVLAGLSFGLMLLASMFWFSTAFLQFLFSRI